MSQLAVLMWDEYFEPGQVIYERGQPANRIFFVVSGRVELADAEGDTWNLDNESLIGVLDASRHRNYARTARATVFTHTIVLNFADYLDVLEQNFDYARQLLQFGAADLAERGLTVGGKQLFAGLDQPTGADPQGLERRKLHTIDRLLVLRSTRMLAQAPVQAVASLAQLATQQSFRRGEHLFHVDEPIKELHVLVSGRVRLSRPQAHVDGLIAPTRVLGGLIAFGCNRRFYEATAESDGVLLVLRKEDLFDVMEDHFGLVRSLFARIAENHEQLMQLRHTHRPPELLGQQSPFQPGNTPAHG